MAHVTRWTNSGLLATRWTGGRQTLRGSLVREGEARAVPAMGARVAVEFSAVEWERAGEGCRAGSGVVSAATKFSIRVGPEPAGPKRGLERPAKQCVDAVALELGGVAEHAARLVQSARQRLPGGPTLKTEPSAGAVISGLPGVGKTRLARAVASAMGLHLEFVDAASIFQTLVGHSEVELVKTFERALQQSPSILVIDGIEAIAASRHAAAESDSALEVGVLGTLLACLDRIKKESQPVFVVGATTRPEDLDAAVVSNGRMDVAVKIEPPTQPQRREILSIMTSAWQSSNLNESYLSQLSDATGGFVGADLLSLCQRALQSSLNDSEARSTDGPTVLPRHFEEALASTYPSALQAHSVSKVVPAESNATTQDQSPFSKVFGLDQAIEAIKVSLIEPLEDCSRFLTYGTVPPKGILLTGPPGSGKSHLALAVASEVQRRGLASFVSVRCTDLLTKVVGDTEKALRELFATARNAAPCVLYFDQIESIAPVRGFDTSTEQTFDRMLSMLLVEMDGFNSSRSRLQSSQTSAAARAAFLKEHVVILASTGNKEQLDPAILRPGYVESSCACWYFLPLTLSAAASTCTWSWRTPMRRLASPSPSTRCRPSRSRTTRTRAWAAPRPWPRSWPATRAGSRPATSRRCSARRPWPLCARTCRPRAWRCNM